MPRIIFTVTNDLSYDQRMQRICHTLAKNGYQVRLVGRKLKKSLPLEQYSFEQKRLNCLCNKGLFFYLEFNIRLFLYLLFSSFDAVCAIDLDTILPCYFVAACRKKIKIYDAHELFTEQKEIVTRPLIHKIWLGIEKFAVPKFNTGYTVNGFIADEFLKKYNTHYAIIRNLPVPYALPMVERQEKYIIYQGAVNEGRSFETLIPAMKQVDATLVICGEGNFFTQLKALIIENKVEHKVILKGYLTPTQLRQLTSNCTLGITLFDPIGLNQFQSLSNRFFDYIMASIPQICVDYPEYKKINDVYQVASMIPDTQTSSIVSALNNLLSNNVLYLALQQNCLKAREELNWEKEEIILIEFYNALFDVTS